MAWLTEEQILKLNDNYDMGPSWQGLPKIDRDRMVNVVSHRWDSFVWMPNMKPLRADPESETDFSRNMNDPLMVAFTVHLRYVLESAGTVAIKTEYTTEGRPINPGILGDVPLFARNILLGGYIAMKAQTKDASVNKGPVSLNGGATGQAQASSPVITNPDGTTVVQGPAGPRGLTGPQGPKGDQGIQGEMGIQGIQGNDGARGPEGPVGPAGTGSGDGSGGTGPTGPQGPKGDTGDQGIQGIQGVTGPQGPKGDDGMDGAMGDQGPMGPAGANGSDGRDGVDGGTGATGPQGIKGEDGRDGDPGEQGIQGEKGDTGPQGPAGSGGGGSFLFKKYAQNTGEGILARNITGVPVNASSSLYNARSSGTSVSYNLTGTSEVLENVVPGSPINIQWEGVITWINLVRLIPMQTAIITLGEGTSGAKVIQKTLSTGSSSTTHYDCICAGFNHMIALTKDEVTAMSNASGEIKVKVEMMHQWRTSPGGPLIARNSSSLNGPTFGYNDVAFSFFQLGA